MRSQTIERFNEKERALADALFAFCHDLDGSIPLSYA
jgi:hypothetical protein